MDSIRDVINKQFPAINQPGHSRGLASPDLRKEEVVKIKCEKCGVEYTAFRVTNRSGRVYEPLKVCTVCRDKSRQAAYLEAANEGLPQEIATQKKKWIAELAIPDIYKDKAEAGFKSFDAKLQPRAYETVKNFNGRSIILSSPELYGVGKTHLVCVLARHLIETTEAVRVRPDGRYIHYLCPVQFVTENALLSRIRATYDQGADETESMVYNRLAGYELLIIDDVGKVQPRDKSFLQGVYFRIIDDRYVNNQSIILTTNLSLTDLEKHIGGACADRLKEMAGAGNIITMQGKSYRTSKPEERTFQARPEGRRDE